MGSVTKLAIAATLAGAIVGLAGPAVAGCKRMGFLVNDYGKDGPTNDAKMLLDKHIANWAAEQGIEKYTVGKKDVKCDLFLNLIVVDEHTCTASATVCWGNDKMPSGEREASSGDAPKKPKKEVVKTEAKPSPDAKSEEKAAEAKPVEVKTEEPKAATAETSAPAKVETGALPVDNKAADAAATSSSEAAKVESTPPSAAASPPAHQAATDAAEAAASAAERAAAAAERAAAAAERAAAALASANASAPSMPGAASTAAAAGASTPATPDVPPLAAEGASKP
jgi:hypothetical protein